MPSLHFGPLSVSLPATQSSCPRSRRLIRRVCVWRWLPSGLALHARRETRMNPDIRWITPLYGFTPNCSHIGVPENARGKLLEMEADLDETTSLVAIYIPEGTLDVYQPGGMRGRIVGAVRL